MTTLMVQTNRLLDNFQRIKKAAGSEIIPVLSGNGSGFGDTAIAEILKDYVGMVAVSRVEEAVRLKTHDRMLEVLLLTPYSTEEEVRSIIEYDITATVASNDSAVLLSGIAEQAGKRAKAHLKFDIGAGFFGFTPPEAAKAAQTVKYLKNIDITGVYTETAPKSGKKLARIQYESFLGILQVLGREGLQYGMAHIAADETALMYPWMKMDAVRVSNSLYGRLSVKDKWGLDKVGRLVSNVCDMRWIRAGTTIGEQRVKIRSNKLVAAVPVGYADGLLVYSDKGHSIFGGRKSYCDMSGRKVRIIGRPGYTTTHIDITGMDCSVGDMVSFDVSPYYINPLIRREYV